MGKALNLVGQRFGRLVVIRNASQEEKPKDINGKPKARTWCVCKCDCGNEIIVLATCLNKGNTKSCGCLQKEKVSKLNEINLIGQKFTKLTVIKKDEISITKGEVSWECLCDCGNIIHVTTNHLTTGNTKSCGCLKGRKLIDITGNKYGKLTVIELDGKHEDGFYYWKCQCDCGKKIIVRGNNLKSGDSQSCGCTKSKGEELINQFLLEHQYSFKKEYTFFDLLSTNNNPLKFDFCILDNDKPIKIIEINGTQHYKKDHPWYSEERAEYDKKKREYCKQHNIPLLDLDYNKDDSIPEDSWLEKLTTFLGGNKN